MGTPNTPQKPKAIESAINVYVKTKSPEVLQNIQEQAKAILHVYLRRKYLGSAITIPTDVIADISGEFIVRIIGETVNTAPVVALLGLADRMIEQLLHQDLNNSPFYEPSTYEEEEVKVPKSIETLTLFLVCYPEDHARLQMLFDPLTFFVAARHAIHIRKQQVNTPTPLMPTKFKTDIGKVLFLAKLYEYDPALLILFTLLKEGDDFLQLCYSTTSINLPPPLDVKKWLITSGEIERTLVDSKTPKVWSKLSAEQIDFLRSLTKHAPIIKNSEHSEPSNTEINDVLKEYARKSIGSILERYEKLQEALLRKIESDVATPEETLKIYQQMQAELTAHTKLISALLVDTQQSSIRGLTK